MQTTRNRIVTTCPVALPEAKTHARIDGDDDDVGLDLMIRAAAMEIEAAAGLALLGQIVTVTLGEWSDRIALPVGPLWVAGMEDHPVMVQARDAAGTLSTVATWWITGQRYPELVLTAPVDAVELIVTYPAGYGADPASIPSDLRLAIMDQAAASYDMRATAEGAQGLSLAASRITARNRRVAI